jgi:DNA adenine methylase
MSYYGGKQRLAKRIISLMPKHTVYVEPFAGGAAVFFMKGDLFSLAARGSDYYREVLNDTNMSIVNSYRVMQRKETADRLLMMLENTPYSRAEYERAGEFMDSDDCVERAWALMVRVNWSFANSLSSNTMQIGTITRNHGASWANKRHRMRDVVERMREVYVEHVDALECIRKWDSPQTLFYCDPPYPGADQGHYSGYTSDDFAALVSALDTCEGSFILSNYDQPGVPQSWDRFEYGVKCNGAITRTTDRTEVLWRVDRSDNMPDKLKRLFERDDQCKLL